MYKIVLIIFIFYVSIFQVNLFIYFIYLFYLFIERCGWVFGLGMWSRVIRCWNRGMIRLS